MCKIARCKSFVSTRGENVESTVYPFITSFVGFVVWFNFLTEYCVWLSQCNFASEASSVRLQFSHSSKHRQNFYSTMVNHIEDDESLRKPLGRCSVFYYGVGHMLNDITSACWFTYLLVFLTDIGLSPRFVTHFLAVRYSDEHGSFNYLFSIKVKRNRNPFLAPAS